MQVLREIRFHLPFILTLDKIAPNKLAPQKYEINVRNGWVNL